jgi:hypothetical protein
MRITAGKKPWILRTKKFLGFLEVSYELGTSIKMTVFGTPCRHRMREIYNSAYFSALQKVCTRMK